MEAVIFVGIQASGKSSFYRQRYFDTHLRISLDMLRTRHRAQRVLAVCLETRQPFVVDNTNPSVEERQSYLAPAREAGFRIKGYYFSTTIQAAIERNEQRPEAQRIPPKGIRGTRNRLVLPSLAEGFDELYFVQLDPGAGFHVEVWNDEVR